MSKKAKTYTKEEYSEVFNAIFGTNIQWQKLSKEELVQLATVLNNPEILLNRLGINVEKRVVREKLVDFLLNVIKQSKIEGPVITFLKELLENRASS